MKIPNGGFKATVFEYVCGLYEFKIRKNSPERGLEGVGYTHETCRIRTIPRNAPESSWSRFGFSM
jgi:hypothetical protein